MARSQDRAIRTSGAGQSALLADVALNPRVYDNAQIFMLDETIIT
jgi:hypothetical protein